MLEGLTSSSLFNSLWEASLFVLVGLLWGATNPFLKRESAGIEKVQHSNKILQFLLELKFLALNWRYVVPFLVNQLGAVLYYLTIGKADITLAVPITNSLTFLFTTLFGWFLGEPSASRLTLLGGAMVTCGVVLCVISKLPLFNID